MFLWGNTTPVLAQHINCCMRLIDVKGNWIGALRSCDLSKAPPEKRSEICQALTGCAAAAEYCSVKQPPSKSPSPSPLPTPTPGATKQPPPESRSSGRR